MTKLLFSGPKLFTTHIKPAKSKVFCVIYTLSSVVVVLHIGDPILTSCGRSVVDWAFHPSVAGKMRNHSDVPVVM